MAVPVVLTVIILGLGLGSAAIMSSIGVQSGSSRDSDSKSALAAADAGMDVAIYRQNTTRTSATQPCVINSGGTLAPGAAAADGWCPEFTGTVGDSSYSYRVSPWASTGTPATGGVRRNMEVVAIGAHDGVSRRLNVGAIARDGAGIFGGFGAVGVDRITISGSAEIGNAANETGVATNGDIYNDGTLCGDAQVGVGREFFNDGDWCEGYSEGEGMLTLPPVDASNVWTSNSNGRFFGQDAKSGSVSWDATSRTLNMGGNSTLTLGGINYSLCKLEMAGGSNLIVAQGASVNIFFHSPEQCGLTGDPVNQLSMTGNPHLGPTSLNPGDMRLLFVGSDTIATSATLDGNPSAGGSDFTLYAPRTDVTLQGDPTYRGAVVGKTLSVIGNAKLLGHPGSLNSNIPVVIRYDRDRYVECTGAAAQSPPDAYC